MSLSGIASSALSALKANATVLDVISDNISNVNTTGYVRRTTTLSTTTANGVVTGVEVTNIKRTVSDYLDQETLTALGTSSQYDTENGIYDQINALLGDVGDGTSVTSRISNVTTALAQLSQSATTSSASSTISALKTLASTISNLSASLTSLQNSVDDQVTSNVDSVNSYIKQITDLNTEIQTTNALGDDTSGLCDQRDQALQGLAKLIDIQTSVQSDGTVKVATTDGTLLTGFSAYAKLTYGGAEDGGGYSGIDITYYSSATDSTVGSQVDLGSHIQSGTLKALLTLRDSDIGELQTELGSLAKAVIESYNGVSNNYTATIPQTTLTGTQTGLLSSDSFSLTGTTIVGVTDADGKLLSTITFDFDNDSYTTSDGASGVIGSTVQELTETLESASGGLITASLDGGVLTLSAADSDNGIVVEDDSDTSTGISHLFGLNDLFSCAIPTATATGVDGGDDAGLTGSDNVIAFSLVDQSGNTVKTYSVAIDSGTSIDSVLDQLGTATDGAVGFSVNDDGSIDIELSKNYSGCSLFVNADNTERGDTGVSITGFFGIGTNTTASYAGTIAVKSGLSEKTLPIAETDLASTDVGDTAVGSGDVSGAVALEGVETAKIAVAAAGGLNAQSTSLSGYSSLVYQDIASRSSDAESNYSTQSDRLTTAQSLQSSVEGVNLDEELANMVVYQQAYNASARLVTTLTDLYDTLLSATSS